MLIREGEVTTYFAENDINGVINNTLNAVKLVKRGTEERTVVEATEGATKFEIAGAVETIGPPQTEQENVKADEPMGIREEGVVNLILKSGEVVSDGDTLMAAANGQVQKLELDATPSAAQLSQVIAQAEEDADATDAAIAVEAELLL